MCDCLGSLGVGEAGRLGGGEVLAGTDRHNRTFEKGMSLTAAGRGCLPQHSPAPAAAGCLVNGRVGGGLRSFVGQNERGFFQDTCCRVLCPALYN